MCHWESCEKEENECIFYEECKEQHLFFYGEDEEEEER